MARQEVTQKQFDDIVKLARRNMADRQQLVGYPERLEICIKGHDPSPGRDFWVEIEAVPKGSKSKKDEEPGDGDGDGDGTEGDGE